MSTWIEYIAAVVLAGFVALTLATVQLRTQQTSIDSTRYRTAKTSAVDVVRMIEHDLKNAGAQHPSISTMSTFALPGGASFGIDSVPDTLGSPRTFQFFAQPVRGQPPRIIRYEWTALADSVTLPSGVTRPLYHFRRFEDGRVDGQSRGTITHLSFNLLTNAGNTITGIQDTRQIFVELRAISPLGSGRTVEETRWTSVIRPMALSIGQGT